MMFYNTKSCQTAVTDNTMNYIEFGTGKRALVIVPGLGDGLSPVHGKMQAAALAYTYRLFARDFKVYIFSRKNNLGKLSPALGGGASSLLNLENNCSTRSMAKDLAEAMNNLGISKAAVMGVSQGGMIAQYLAIDYPDLVESLVLAVTVSRPNETMQTVVSEWIELAKHGDYKGLMINTAEHSYTEKYLKKYRLFYPLLGMIGKPKSFERFLLQADSCIRHNAYFELDKIVCPTLIIGGECDKIMGKNSSHELAEKIKNSSLFIYKSYGHAAYEEAEDFNDRVWRFFMS